MDKAINKICTARLCIPCALDMEETHVLRCMGKQTRDPCQRCGQSTVTLEYRYTLSKRGFDKYKIPY